MGTFRVNGGRNQDTQFDGIIWRRDWNPPWLHAYVPLGNTARAQVMLGLLGKVRAHTHTHTLTTHTCCHTHTHLQRCVMSSEGLWHPDRCQLSPALRCLNLNKGNKQQGLGNRGMPKAICHEDGVSAELIEKHPCKWLCLWALLLWYLTGNKHLELCTDSRSPSSTFLIPTSPGWPRLDLQWIQVKVESSSTTGNC